MAKYTVTLTRAHVRYTQAIIDVEANDADATSMIAKRQACALEWQPTDGEYPAYLDIEIQHAAGVSETWRED